MENYELKNKIDALCADKEFCENMAMCSTVDELVELFAAEGIEIDAAEMEDALAASQAAQGTGELNEGDLDNVAGGFVSGTAFLIGSILYSAGCIAWAAYCARRR